MTTSEKQFLIDRLADAARTGRISRRSFMSTAMTAGITASAATGLWTSSAIAQPKPGGTYRVAQHDGNTTDTHDMGKYQSNFEISLVHTIRSFLTMINQDGTLGPDLATEWSASEDASQWTFKLSDTATFHSGAKVTANDVLASMNYHRGEESTSAAKALLASVTDIVDNGDNSVTFVLESGNADLPWLLTDYHLCIVPANADGTANWQSGDGSGPYKTAELEFGVGGRFVRHDGWHGEGAYFDEVVFTVVNDPNARQTALITGDADAASLLESKTLGLMARNPDIEIDNVPSGQAITMPMHVDVAPFDIPEVRMALKLAINREELVEKIAFGGATLGNDFHHSPAQPYFPDIPQRTYDPDQAKSLLASVGMSDLTVDFSTADSITTGAVDAAVLYAEQAKAAGITVNVVREPNDGYWSDVWLVKPFCMVTWGSRPTPDVMYTLAYAAEAAWNESHWKNERFNELLLLAKGELNDEVRAEMYAEMALLARDDGGTIIPYFPNFVYGRRKAVQHGGTVSPAWQMDGYRHASRWYFT